MKSGSLCLALAAACLLLASSAVGQPEVSTESVCTVCVNSGCLFCEGDRTDLTDSGSSCLCGNQDGNGNNFPPSNCDSFDKDAKELNSLIDCEFGLVRSEALLAIMILVPLSIVGCIVACVTGCGTRHCGKAGGHMPHVAYLPGQQPRVQAAAAPAAAPTHTVMIVNAGAPGQAAAPVMAVPAANQY